MVASAGQLECGEEGSVSDPMSVDAWIFDDRDGRIRPLRTDDPQTAHDAALKARGFHLIARPVVFADGRIMGELLNVADEKASVATSRENGLSGAVYTMPVRRVA